MLRSIRFPIDIKLKEKKNANIKDFYLLIYQLFSKKLIKSFDSTKTNIVTIIIFQIRTSISFILKKKKFLDHKKNSQYLCFTLITN